MKTLKACLVLAAAIGTSSVANAAIISSIPGGTVIPMPVLNYFGTGPQTFGSPTVTWSETDPYSVFGYNGGYGFADNGFWSGLTMAATNDGTSTMTFQFASPVNAVGGFLNYAPGYGSPATIAVYDTSDNLIESDVLGFSTGGGSNTGQFVGFSETTPIAYFTLTGSYIGLADLTESTSAPGPVPGAGLAGLAALALAGLYARARRA